MPHGTSLAKFCKVTPIGPKVIVINALNFKMQPTSDHMANFLGDQPKELGDLA